MNLFCVGLSHHTATVETREQYAANAEAECALQRAGCAEALVLTTCNRVEVYAAAERRISTADIADCLNPEQRSGREHEAKPFYRYEDGEAVRHLFRVASGLDSMVVGETEVLGQIKKAYDVSRAGGKAGPYLHRLFQRAFRAAKQVRSRTEITRGTVSVGSVAVDLAGRIFGSLNSCKVLVLGAGENSERTIRALVSRGVTDLLVSNRSPARAHDLVACVGGSAVPFEHWLHHCRDVDILITSTSAERALITPENFEAALRDRRDGPLFIIDIAVPRNVDARVNDLAGVFLYDIDALQSVADQALALRRQQIVVAEEIIEEHVTSFQQTVVRGLQWHAQNVGHPSVRVAEQGS
jgi:glutamyl-tRNA reductase